MIILLTRYTASLVAITMISEQETTPGHTVSTAAFAAAMTSQPRMPRFGGAVFSPELPSSRMEVSHPF